MNFYKFTMIANFFCTLAIQKLYCNKVWVVYMFKMTVNFKNCFPAKYGIFSCFR